MHIQQISILLLLLLVGCGSSKRETETRGGITAMRAAYSADELRDNITYPPIAQRHGIEAEVLTKVWLGTAGQIDRVEILSVKILDADRFEKDLLETAKQLFIEESKEAIHKTSFEPAEQMGHPIRSKLIVTVSFSL